MNKVIRYSTNGLDAISENGVDKLFGESKDVDWSPAVFDERHKEYLIRFETDSSKLEYLEDIAGAPIGGIYSGIVVVEEEVPLQEAIGIGVYDDIPIKLTAGRRYTLKSVGTPVKIIYPWDDSFIGFTVFEGEPVSFTAETDGYLKLGASLSNSAIYLLGSDVSWYSPIDNKGKVIAYSELTKGFVGSRSFHPHFMASLNEDLFSFKRGQLYVHNSSNVNFFYDKKYSSYVACVFNRNQFAPQIARAIQVESDVAPYVHIRTELPYVQSTDIAPSEFKRFDSVWYGEVKRDRLTPGFDTPEEGLISGDVVRGQFIKCYISFSDKFTLRFVNLELQKDRGHRLMP
jgi:hypothetical protein